MGKVAVIGLGLIGGSIAKAYRKAGWDVYAFDTDSSILGFSMLEGTVCGELDRNNIGAMDLIHIATYPDGAIAFLREYSPFISRATLVMDDCGTKRKVCAEGFRLAEEYGYMYAGAHPMAGTRYSGYKYSRATMFQGAPMVVVPPRTDDITALERIKESLEPMGIKRVVFTSAEDHDRMIAFTSQLAHVVSNAYVKSPNAQTHKGFSAGSFRDMTRVAWLNERMWTELFIENRDFLLEETRRLISNLQQYCDAMEACDTVALQELLREGRIAKELSEKSADPDE